MVCKAPPPVNPTLPPQSPREAVRPGVSPSPCKFAPRRLAGEQSVLRQFLRLGSNPYLPPLHRAPSARPVRARTSLVPAHAQLRVVEATPCAAPARTRAMTGAFAPDCCGTAPPLEPRANPRRPPRAVKRRAQLRAQPPPARGPAESARSHLHPEGPPSAPSPRLNHRKTTEPTPHPHHQSLIHK